MLQAAPVLTGLRAVREAEGFTQAELADAAGVSVTTIRKLETDREYARRLTSITAARIAFCLGASLAELMTVLDLPLTGRIATIDEHCRRSGMWPGQGAKWRGLYDEPQS